ncbi:hypothetical protein [Nocardia sp. NPDC047038]|uniref:hypothetical protein n=1 Tax=Nocardia sp. NPDC047038 TaxID=3154338 RepID=UPI003408EA3A
MATRRVCGDLAALRCLKSLAQRIWSPERRFHIGDIAWARNSVPDTTAEFRVSVWEERGVVLGESDFASAVTRS